MIKITLDIDGMVCGMCEAYINDAVRKVFTVKKAHPPTVNAKSKSLRKLR